jgi:hypothetical protein
VIVGNVSYQINKAGQGTPTNPYILSLGLPRTIRVGVEAFRF